MTERDTAKAYLGQIEDLEKRIERNNRRIAHWKAERINCTSDPSREFVSGGGSGNASYARLTEDIEDAEAENVKLIIYRNKILLEITEEPEQYSKVLYARYVNRNRLLPIALGLGRSYDRMRHLHLEALDHFAAHHEMKFYE